MDNDNMNYNNKTAKTKDSGIPIFRTDKPFFFEVSFEWSKVRTTY